MDRLQEVKIVMCGPKSSGKTALANYIADAVQNAENPTLAPTQPTKGVRIVEFDRTIPSTKGKGTVSTQPLLDGARTQVTLSSAICFCGTHDAWDIFRRRSGYV